MVVRLCVIEVVPAVDERTDHKRRDKYAKARRQRIGYEVDADRDPTAAGFPAAEPRNEPVVANVGEQPDIQAEYADGDDDGESIAQDLRNTRTDGDVHRGRRDGHGHDEGRHLVDAHAALQLAELIRVDRAVPFPDLDGERKQQCSDRCAHHDVGQRE